MSTLRTAAAALLWLVAAIAIALGAAGLVTAMDPPPGETVRVELTADGDALVGPHLDAIERQLVGLAADVDRLGIQARGALAALSGADQATVDAAIRAGDGHLLDVTIGALAIREALDAVPLIGTPEGAYRVSVAERERFDRLASAVEEVDGLEVAWAGLGTGSLAASRLSAMLADHDAAIQTAAGQGRDADYAAAIETIADAEAAIAEARTLRDTLARSVDVTVLDEWLDRNAAYDVALRDLYTALDGVGGRVTADVRAAIDAERAARERLPADSRGLILIMAEIGQGGMNHAVIAIEEARGALADALAPTQSTSPAPATPGTTTPP